MARWALLLTACAAFAQQPAPRFQYHLEFRTWFERRSGQSFGLERDIDATLMRTRVGIEFRAADWLKLAGTAQDARAPGYGSIAPGSVRDELDLHEAYAEFFPGRERGFGAIVGRQMVRLGGGNLVGVPEWGNTGRTYDTARVFYRLPKARFETLLVSIIRPRPEAFNKPVLGDRVWGTYSTLSSIIPGALLDLYLLRHDQNIPAGFPGPGRLGITTYGGRIAGKLPGRFQYVLENTGQTGAYGEAAQRGYAAIANISRRLALWRGVDLIAEYKYASRDFDQLYPANHDRFGHADQLGFRNLRNVQLRARLTLPAKGLFSLLFNDNRLADASGAMYNPQGRVIARSPSGLSGRNIGREFAVITAHPIGHFQIGFGFAHWFVGDFVRQTTPGANPRYLYIHTGTTW